MNKYVIAMYQRGYRDALKAAAQRPTLNEAPRFAQSMAKYLSSLIAQSRLIENAIRASQNEKPLPGQPGNPRIMALRLMAQAAMRSQRYVDILVNAAASAFPSEAWVSASPPPPGVDKLLDFYHAIDEINKFTNQIIRPLGYDAEGENGLLDQYEFFKKIAQQFKRAMDDMTAITRK